MYNRLNDEHFERLRAEYSLIADLLSEKDAEILKLKSEKTALEEKLQGSLQTSNNTSTCAGCDTGNHTIEQLQGQISVHKSVIEGYDKRDKAALAAWNALSFEIESIFAKLRVVTTKLGKDGYDPHVDISIKRAELKADVAALHNARLAGIRDPLPALLRLSEIDYIVQGKEYVGWLQKFAKKASEGNIPQLVEISKAIPVPQRPVDPAIKEAEEQKKASDAVSSESHSIPEEVISKQGGLNASRYAEDPKKSDLQSNQHPESPEKSAGLQASRYTEGPKQGGFQSSRYAEGPKKSGCLKASRYAEGPKKSGGLKASRYAPS